MNQEKPTTSKQALKQLELDKITKELVEHELQNLTIEELWNL